MIEEFLYYGIPHLYCKVDTVCWNVTDNEVTELRDKRNKQYDIRYARVVIISLGKDKVMWRSCAEKRNTNLIKNYGRGNYNNSLCW